MGEKKQPSALDLARLEADRIDKDSVRKSFSGWGEIFGGEALVAPTEASQQAANAPPEAEMEGRGRPTPFELALLEADRISRDSVRRSFRAWAGLAEEEARVAQREAPQHAADVPQEGVMEETRGKNFPSWLEQAMLEADRIDRDSVTKSLRGWAELADKEARVAQGEAPQHAADGEEVGVKSTDKK